MIIVTNTDTATIRKYTVITALHTSLQYSDSRVVSVQFKGSNILAPAVV